MFIRLQLAIDDKRFLNLCEEAASHGLINCLKLAHEIGILWNDKACNRAMSAGHLECLRYARENECPWSKEICSNAALNGHKNCLVYSRGNAGDRVTKRHASTPRKDIWDIWTACLPGIRTEKRVPVTRATSRTTFCLFYTQVFGCPKGETILHN